MPFLRAAVFATLVLTSVFTAAAAAQAPDEGYSREQLQPLTKFEPPLETKEVPHSPPREIENGDDVGRRD